MTSTNDAKIEIKDEIICSDEEDDSALNGSQDTGGVENGVWKMPKQEYDENQTNNEGNQFVERYKCHHCDRSYKNIRSLNQHFREVQVCRVCKLSLPSVEEFTSHVLEDHTVGALCGVCMISFRSRARLVEHVRTHTQVAIKKTDYRSNKKQVSVIKTCENCRAELSPLSPHTCHANVCKVCRKPLRTRSEFEVHMMRLHCTDDVCQFCGARLSSLQKLISHLKSHTSLRFPAHKCLKCGLRFSNEVRLAGHDCQPPEQQNASNANTLKGAEQESMSMDSADGTSQEEEETEEESLKHQCLVCDERFKLLKDLKQHQAENHSCRFCKKILTSQTEFEKHLMEEHSSKDECQFCMRKFVCSTALRAHLKTHTAITHKLHSCSKCKKKFASLKDKSKHLCLKFECFFCPYRFANKADRENHCVTNHSDTQMLECHTCLKSFPNRQQLKRHIMAEHK